MAKTRLAVLGAGLIGARHAGAISSSEDAELVALADQTEAGRRLASNLGARHYDDFVRLLEAEALDGVICALPNQMHRAAALAAIERGLPVLVEKPLADTLEAAEEIVRAGERAGVAVMVGHHRRFNPRVGTARRIIGSGALGRLVAVSAVWAARKPEDYFSLAWRREEGGGPILINLIHDIDCLRHLCGEIVEVQAFTSSQVRRLPVEDTAVVALRFEGGALGTITLSDASPSPWGWEAGSADNPTIAASRQNCYRFLGTAASLDFPNLTLWRHAEGVAPSWSEPMHAQSVACANEEALPAQIGHFARVIRGEETPRISGRDGFATLAATLAVKAAALAGRSVRPRVLA